MKLYVMLALSFLLLSSCNSYAPHATVKITNLASNSGGSGTVVYNSESYSDVLTNGHVCEVAKKGGLVHTLDGTAHFVASYKTSELHDLCLIRVAANLGKSDTVAYRAPAFYDNAVVSGHPHLLPNIITTGHFSGKQIIQVMTGFRECTEADLTNPITGLFCSILGKLPIVKSYESSVVSATIQPGSSGSAVYGEQGDISAVIFAGSGDIGYGFAVPYEYVYNFVNLESKGLTSKYPDNQVSLVDATRESRKDIVEKIKNICKGNLTDDQKEICDLFQSSSKYNDLIVRQ